MEGIDERSRELIKTRILNKIKNRLFRSLLETMLNDRTARRPSAYQGRGLVIRTSNCTGTYLREISALRSHIPSGSDISNIVLSASVYSIMDNP